MFIEKNYTNKNIEMMLLIGQIVPDICLFYVNVTKSRLAYPITPL